MSGGYVHIDDVPWAESEDGAASALRWKTLLDDCRGGSKEFVFGYGELDAGRTLPLHSHRQTEAIFLTGGSARVRLGKRVVHIASPASVLFPAGVPHAVESRGPGPLRYVCTYASEASGHDVAMTPADEEAAACFDVPNAYQTRWAVAEDFEDWYPIEPSKGRKGMQIRRLIDLDRGKCAELMAGTCLLSAGAHYTRHYHDQPEIYYGLSGRGVVYVGNAEVAVHPGVAIYVGSRVVHGADALGTEPFRMYWLYGTESTGQNFNWTPVEDIYTEARTRGPAHMALMPLSITKSASVTKLDSSDAK